MTGTPSSGLKGWIRRRAPFGWIVIIVGILAAGFAFAAPYEVSNAGNGQPGLGTGPGQPASAREVLVGGDDAGNAVVIHDLPFTDTGNTCSFNDDYPVNCATGASPAPDVVYRFIPSLDMCVDISLCQSDYNVSLYVWQGSAGNLIACNDDACGPSGQQSRIPGLLLHAGTYYYIVVDGFGTQLPNSFGCGNYELRVSQCPAPCTTPLLCPQGAIVEGEPLCTLGYVDQYDGGCNSSPPVFKDVTCPSTICGEYGSWCTDPDCFVHPSHSLRDTDWYRLQVTTPLSLHLCVHGELSTQVGVISASKGCPGTFLSGSEGYSSACESFCEEVALAPDTYWIFVAQYANDGRPETCGSRYLLSLCSDCAPTPAKNTSWGRLKVLYR